MLDRQAVAVRGNGAQQRSGRNEVGLDYAVNERRPARAVARYRVIRAGNRPPGVRGPDGDRKRVIARREYSAVDSVALRILSQVARSDYASNACVHCSLKRLAERISFIRLRNSSAEREICNANVISAAISD